MNGLKGFNVTGVIINSTATPGEPNLKGFAYIPNPSVITVALGNATINDMTLVPGNNTLPMSGIIDQTLIAASLNSSGFVTLSIAGQSAIYNGQHLTYYVRSCPTQTFPSIQLLTLK
jgi:hypothetical protein